jgi:hypothetical protein
MAAYIYYKSTRPVEVLEWETHSDYVSATVLAIDLIKSISDGGLIQIADKGETANPKVIICYFENRETLDSYLSNNPVNVVSVCSDPSVVEYCQNNNIIYEVSINDTSKSLTEVISMVDPENFDDWWTPYSSS